MDENKEVAQVTDESAVESAAPKVELTPEQREATLREIEVLTQVMNLTMFVPKFDQNKDVSKRKLTTSVQLSVLHNSEMEHLKGVVINLLNKL